MGNHSFQRESEAVERAFDEASLTDREKDAARSLLQGMTAQEAADIMGVSPSSVGSYRKRAYEKLGVGSGRELVSLHRAWPVAEVNVDVNEKLRERGLNETQASVCSLIAAGKTTSEIAADLGVAAGTVNSARAYGYQLLHIHSREELVELLRDDGQSDERGGADAVQAGAKRKRRAFVAVAAVLAVVAVIVLWQTGAQPSVAGGSGRFDAAAQRIDPVSFTATAGDGTVLFGVNENGQRFGRRDWVTAYLGGIADLYAAEGENGEKGYAPQNAEPGAPLYDMDGRTELGKFSLFEWQVNDLGTEKPAPDATPFAARDSEGHILFGVNEAGRRFGSKELADLYLGGKLDLEATTASNGAHGYVYADDVETNPVLTVYAEDGVTELGTLESG